MNNFKDFIKNKNVAIVGPAAYMMNHDFGLEIDEHDAVVRINRSYESVEKFSANVGSRTDVLYSCMIEKQANAGKIDPHFLRDLGIKHVCVPPSSNMKGLSRETRFHDLIDLEKVKSLNELIPVRLVDHHFHNDLAIKVDCRPNTGYMAIYDLIRMEPKNLSIYGFSFYLDGFVDGVKEGVEKEQNKTPEEFTVQCFNSKRHVQKNMWSFAKETLPRIRNVKLDPVLDKILKMDSLDREKFKEMCRIS